MQQKRAKENKIRVANRLRQASRRILNKVVWPRTPETRKKLEERLSRKLSHCSQSLASSDVSKHDRSEILKGLLQFSKWRYLKNKQKAEFFKEDLFKTHTTDRKISELAQKLGVESQVLYRLLKSEPRKSSSKRKVSEEERKRISDFICRNSISMELPHKKHAGKRYLRMTKREAYQHWKKDLDTTERVLGYSTFVKCIPSNIHLLRDLPDQGCGCDICMNAELKAKCLCANDFKGVSARLTVNVNKTMCNRTNQNSDELSILDFDLDCIQRRCDHCSEERILTYWRQMNPGIDWDKSVVFSEWKKITVELQKNNELKRRQIMECVKTGSTILEVTELFASDLKEYSKHQFNFTWQAKQFEEARLSLRVGDVLMVCDFNTNFSQRQWKEPQSTHWSRKQITVHNTALYYLCPEFCKDKNGKHEIVKEEIMITSDDLKHDCFAVEAFTDRILKHLEISGVAVQRVIRFSDNCAGQYKSYKVFEILSRRKIPFCLNYFGAKHGKSAADGIGGRTMQVISLAISAGVADITDAKSMADFLMDTNSTNTVRKKTKKNWRITPTERSFVQEFYRSQSHIVNGQSVLKNSLKKTYTSYVMSVREKGLKVISMSSFCRLKPGDILCLDKKFPSDNSVQTQSDVISMDELSSLCSQESQLVASECNHGRRNYFCVNEIERNHYSMENVKRLARTQKIHSVRNTGTDGMLEVREHSCFCSCCKEGKYIDCPHGHFVKKFCRVNIRSGTKRAKVCQQFSNKLWAEGNSVGNMKWKTERVSISKKGKQKRRCITKKSHLKSSSDSTSNSNKVSKRGKKRRRRLFQGDSDSKNHIQSEVQVDRPSRKGALLGDSAVGKCTDSDVSDFVVPIDTPEKSTRQLRPRVCHTEDDEDFSESERRPLIHLLSSPANRDVKFKFNGKWMTTKDIPLRYRCENISILLSLFW